MARHRLSVLDLQMAANPRRQLDHSPELRNGNHVKTCTKCGEEKPLEEFSIQRRTKDGRQPRCKACFAEYRQTNRAAIAERKVIYYAENRDAILAQAAEYHARPEVKVHTAKRKAAYYQANRETFIARQAEYYAKNPHVHWEHGYRVRAREYGFELVIESFTEDDLIARYGNQCWHCGGPFEELDHHPVPVAHGGPHILENCKPSCVRCNRARTSVRWGGQDRSKK